VPGIIDLKISFPFLQKHWTRSDIALQPPFCTIDLASGAVSHNNPDFSIDLHQVTEACGEDNWNDCLTEDEWKIVSDYFRKFETISGKMDFVAFSVGRETRKIWLTPGAHNKPKAHQRGLRFGVPRQSLMECLKWGYFEDLLIALFMKIETINMGIYPDFYWLVGKLGGMKVFTKAQERDYWARYIRRNPRVVVEWYMREQSNKILARGRHWAATGPLRKPLRAVYHAITRQKSAVTLDTSPEMHQ
jgi:hypothetical protein